MWHKKILQRLKIPWIRETIIKLALKPQSSVVSHLNFLDWRNKHSLILSPRSYPPKNLFNCFSHSLSQRRLWSSPWNDTWVAVVSVGRSVPYLRVIREANTIRKVRYSLMPIEVLTTSLQNKMPPQCQTVWC